MTIKLKNKRDKSVFFNLKKFLEIWFLKFKLIKGAVSARIARKIDHFPNSEGVKWKVITGNKKKGTAFEKIENNK